jgi:hypothetical protein
VARATCPCERAVQAAVALGAIIFALAIANFLGAGV